MIPSQNPKTVRKKNKKKRGRKIIRIICNTYTANMYKRRQNMKIKNNKVHVHA